MDLHGAIVVNPDSGDPERKPGFTLAVPSVGTITTKKHRYHLRPDIEGYYCKIDDTVEVGPFPTAERATWYAKMYAGVWERAS